MQGMKDGVNLQIHFVRAAESVTPFGLISIIQDNERKHVFNFFDLLIELITNARARAYFSKFKEKYASRHSK